MTDYGWHTILGSPPSKSNSYRIITIGSGNKRHGSLTKSDALNKYEQSFYMQIGDLRNKQISGFFEFHCRVYNDSMRKDIDNSTKVLLDCLQYTGTIVNDNKCVKLVMEKFIDKERPRCEFKIIAID
jgi:Holliday junction resolvase RusA-like endonuclease